MTSSHTTSIATVRGAFEDFLKTPWPLPDDQMSERKRLWLAFEAGATFAMNRIVEDAKAFRSDEQRLEEKNHG